MRGDGAVYAPSHWPKPSLCDKQSSIFYKDLQWLEQAPVLPPEDVPLPNGYSINPEETEESAIQGPPRDKLIDLWDEVSKPLINDDLIESFRNFSLGN
jgi:hypothetical protein